ncbi:MAG TPA: hypothetical protein VF230_01540 [Acidimicrobiales bacterium]
MGDTTLEIETESAGRYRNATEADLHRLFSQLGAETGGYLILERADLPEQYAQTALEVKPKPSLHATGRYVVEYRDGPHSHHQAFTEDASVVFDVLAGWAFDRPGWRDLVAWQPLDLGF